MFMVKAGIYSEGGMPLGTDRFKRFSNLKAWKAGEKMIASRINLSGKISVALLSAVFLLVVVNPAQAVQCVNKNGTGGCFDNLQDAVDAAVPGETIKVNPGTYRDTADLNQDGLTLVGTGKKPSKVKIDGDQPENAGGPVITISGANVTVKKLTIQNGFTTDSDGHGVFIASTGNGAKLINVRIIGSDEDAVNIDGADDVTIKNSFIQGPGGDAVNALADTHRLKILNTKMWQCDDDAISVVGDDLRVEDVSVNSVEDGNGVDADGDRTKVLDSSFTGVSDDIVVDLSGDDVVVRGVSIKGTESDDCMEVDGDRAVISNNTLTFCDEIGMDISGDDVLVEGNKITYCVNAGIELDGADFVVRDNKVSHTLDMAYDLSCDTSCGDAMVMNNKASYAFEDDDCFEIDASVAGMTVQGNIGQWCADNAFDIGGTGITLVKNVAKYVGADSEEAGYYITGTNHVLRKNLAELTQGDGFRVGETGSSITFTGNESLENLDDGFVINGDDCTLNDNISKFNLNNGVWIGSTADGTSGSGNVSKKNRLNFLDEGTNTTVTGTWP
jgi:hypothetical protein